MISLINSTGDNLSTAIRLLSPLKMDGIKIENRLLDGSMHIQTIGTPQGYYTFDMLANYNELNRLIYASAIMDKLKLTVDGIEYEGFIKEVAEERITNRTTEEGKRFYILPGIRFDMVEGSI